MRYTEKSFDDCMTAAAQWGACCRRGHSAASACPWQHDASRLLNVLPHESGSYERFVTV